MNDVSVAESSDLEFEPQLPDEYFPIWRCIACGAMGNSNPCMGVCDYHKLAALIHEGGFRGAAFTIV
jgi:hypothetical protein